MQNQAVLTLELENDLRKAIDNQEFCLFYQPIISLSTGLLTGFEALLRWQHPTRGLIYSHTFISRAEETGLINHLGNWVLNEACRQLQVWLEDYPELSCLDLHINISPLQFKQINFIE
ncbi:MAG: EAL domain-containing protein [Gloeocapsa sp. DLM2.Bin57]|nr:MAG: EAL domain-containing protein [Gloeocapsa sp. DLM2.Bin57]